MMSVAGFQICTMTFSNLPRDMTITHHDSLIQWRIQDFPEGGASNHSQGGREHAKFSVRKLHEIERIWTPRGGRASLTPPPRSANVITVIFYTVLLIIGAAGNLIVFVTLFRARQRKSRVNRFIMHLCIADMTVVFIMMPLEIGWHVTVSWEAGDIACRILMFFRAFGFYLSSFILIVISLDRVFTVTHPMKLQDAEHRGKVMLILSWIMSTVASLPQVSFLF